MTTMTRAVETTAVETTLQDAHRATMQVRGHVTASALAPLAEAIDAHLHAGRRFLRINLSGVRELDRDALGLFQRTHELLLSRRGTLILTGAHSAVMSVLRRAGLDRVLFVLAPSADERAE